MQKLSSIPRFQELANLIREAQFCPRCRHWYLDPANREHIYHTTLCLACEHVEGERRIYEK